MSSKLMCPYACAVDATLMIRDMDEEDEEDWVTVGSNIMVNRK